MIKNNIFSAFEQIQYLFVWSDYQVKLSGKTKLCHLVWELCLGFSFEGCSNFTEAAKSRIIQPPHLCLHSTSNSNDVTFTLPQNEKSENLPLFLHCFKRQTVVVYAFLDLSFLGSFFLCLPSFPPCCSHLSFPSIAATCVLFVPPVWPQRMWVRVHVCLCSPLSFHLLCFVVTLSDVCASDVAFTVFLPALLTSFVQGFWLFGYPAAAVLSVWYSALASSTFYHSEVLCKTYTAPLTHRSQTQDPRATPRCYFISSGPRDAAKTVLYLL